MFLGEWRDCTRTQELVELFDGKHPFQFPKPSRLLRHLVQFGTQDDDIFLDFFAGSCTTAQAVLELNREDGGNRRFIMVQLPEPTGQLKVPTIAEIGKERIRRVIAKLKGEEAEKLPFEGEGLADAAGSKAAAGLPKLDLGFKVFKLGESNFTDMAVGGADPLARMSLFIDPLVAGWEPLPVIWEVAVKEAGFGLNSTIAKVDLAGTKKLYRVPDPEKEQTFLICLDGTLVLDTLEPLHLTQDDLFVCRDAALDDTGAANLALQCRLRTI